MRNGTRPTVHVSTSSEDSNGSSIGGGGSERSTSATFSASRDRIASGRPRAASTGSARMARARSAATLGRGGGGAGVSTSLPGLSEADLDKLGKHLLHAGGGGGGGSGRGGGDSEYAGSGDRSREQRAQTATGVLPRLRSAPPGHARPARATSANPVSRALARAEARSKRHEGISLVASSISDVKGAMVADVKLKAAKERMLQETAIQGSTVDWSKAKL